MKIYNFQPVEKNTKNTDCSRLFSANNTSITFPLHSQFVNSLFQTGTYISLSIIIASKSLFISTNLRYDKRMRRYPEKKKRENRTHEKKVRKDIIFFLSAMLLFAVFFQFFARPTIIRGSSMADTLENNDIVLVWQWNYSPALGDIVITNNDTQLGASLVKRIVAIEGQQYNSHSYQNISPSIIIIPQNQVFLLGDNYDFSVDSRDFGTVSVDAIEGKIFFRVFPFSKFGKIN